jgi:hypothetical protein
MIMKPIRLFLFQSMFLCCFAGTVAAQDSSRPVDGQSAQSDSTRAVQPRRSGMIRSHVDLVKVEFDSAQGESGNLSQLARNIYTAFTLYTTGGDLGFKIPYPPGKIIVGGKHTFLFEESLKSIPIEDVKSIAVTYDTTGKNTSVYGARGLVCAVEIELKKENQRQKPSRTTDEQKSVQSDSTDTVRPHSGLIGSHENATAMEFDPTTGLNGNLPQLTRNVYLSFILYTQGNNIAYGYRPLPVGLIGIGEELGPIDYDTLDSIPIGNVESITVTYGSTDRMNTSAYGVKGLTCVIEIKLKQ